MSPITYLDRLYISVSEILIPERSDGLTGNIDNLSTHFDRLFSVLTF
jgi:hypothetical protein